MCRRRRRCCCCCCCCSCAAAAAAAAGIEGDPGGGPGARAQRTAAVRASSPRPLQCSHAAAKHLLLVVHPPPLPGPPHRSVFASGPSSFPHQSQAAASRLTQRAGASLYREGRRYVSTARYPVLFLGHLNECKKRQKRPKNGKTAKNGRYHKRFCPVARRFLSLS